MYARHSHLAPYIRDPQIRQVRFRDRLVYLLVLADPTQEVVLRLLRRRVFVVWVARADLQRDVCGDDRRIVTKRFKKDEIKPFFFGDTFFNAGPGGIAAPWLNVTTHEVGEVDGKYLRALVLFVASAQPPIKRRSWIPAGMRRDRTKTRTMDADISTLVKPLY